MFWWSVPVGQTGFMVALISGLFACLFGMAIDGDLDDLSILSVLFWIFATICAIGVLATIGGFFFWSLGEIWKHYI